MKRIGMIASAVGALALAAAGWVYFSGGSGEPSTEVTAPPLAAPSSTTIPRTAPATSVTAATTTPSTEPAAGAVTFELDPSGSTATFTLDEELRGERNTVVGSTSELAGQILVDFDDPASSQLGEIVINARTFQTDSSFRDRAIRGQILQSSSDEFEFITFAPTAVEGLTSNAQVPFSFTVTGDLTIRDVTAPVAFDVEIVAAGAEQVSGTATAQVLRSDFGLNIPSVPSVANVTDEVVLSLEFAATPAG